MVQWLLCWTSIAKVPNLILSCVLQNLKKYWRENWKIGNHRFDQVYQSWPVIWHFQLWYRIRPVSLPIRCSTGLTGRSGLVFKTLVRCRLLFSHSLSIYSLFSRNSLYSLFFILLSHLGMCNIEKFRFIYWIQNFRNR